jgi:hypothetical protein
LLRSKSFGSKLVALETLQTPISYWRISTRGETRWTYHSHLKEFYITRTCL